MEDEKRKGEGNYNRGDKMGDERRKRDGNYNRTQNGGWKEGVKGK